MAKYYTKKWQVLCASVAGAEPPQGVWPSIDYARTNRIVGLCVTYLASRVMSDSAGRLVYYDFYYERA